MSWFSKHLLWRIFFVVSLLSPFVLFSTLMQPWKSSNAFGLFAQELLYPFEYAWHASVSTVVGGWRHYLALSHAAKENDELKSKLNQLSTHILNYDEQQLEISRLRSLLGFSGHYGDRRVVAEVVGGARGDQFYTMRISKGELDEIRVGMPVVTGNGVVGRIIRTGKKYSDVHLLTDSNFHLDVLIQRTRVRGVLRGRSGDFCQLTMGQRTDVKIGDTIITSGIMGAFPKGLPVGKVTKISYESDDISQVIIIEPWVDHRRVEEVVVLQYDDDAVQKITETIGKEWLEKSLENLPKN